MALPDTTLDTAIAYGFTVKIDGVTLPSVISVSDLTAEVDKVEYNQQTADGKFVPRQLPARQKGGEFTVTRGITGDKAVTQWLTQVFTGDLKGARKTAEVAVTDYQGATIRSFSFENCWVKSVKMNQVEAGGTSVLTEEFVICFDSMKVQ